MYLYGESERNCQWVEIAKAELQATGCAGIAKPLQPRGFVCVSRLSYPAVADAVGTTAAMPLYAMADAAALAVAQQRAAMAEERLTKLKAMVEDLRRDRDAWREQAQGRLLPAPVAKMSWWRWLRSSA